MDVRTVGAGLSLALLALVVVLLLSSQTAILPSENRSAEDGRNQSQELPREPETHGEGSTPPIPQPDCKTTFTGDIDDLLQEGPPDGPTDTRYVNLYERVSKPEWIPEEDVSPGNRTAATYEVTRYPDGSPTRDHLEASWNLYKQTFSSAEEKGWFDFDEALEDGYVSVDGLHYINVDYSFDGHDLDPNRPEQLIYYPRPGEEDGRVLVGVMYTTPTEGEQIGGPATLWHYHPSNGLISDLIDGLIERSPNVSVEEARRAIEYSEGDRTVEMIHVWFIEHPEGPFASTMSVPPRCLEDPDMMGKEEFQRYLLSKYRKYFEAESSLNNQP